MVGQNNKGIPLYKVIFYEYRNKPIDCFQKYLKTSHMLGAKETKMKSRGCCPQRGKMFQNGVGVGGWHVQLA